LKSIRSICGNANWQFAVRTYGGAAPYVRASAAYCRMEPMKQQADIAMIQLGDETRMTCVGCADILERAGLLLVERAFTFGYETSG
jgi:hypothetical protein